LPMTAADDMQVPALVVVLQHDSMTVLLSPPFPPSPAMLGPRPRVHALSIAAALTPVSAAMLPVIKTVLLSRLSARQPLHCCLQRGCVVCRAVLGMVLS
jgi:hypothetical protein